MNPFSNQQAGVAVSTPTLFGKRPALLTFIVCAAVGLVAVGFHIRASANKARVRARTEALARSAAIEGQLNQAVVAAQVLGHLATQNGGTIPNFQRAAVEFLRSQPAFTTIALEPAGVVSESVSRAGRERPTPSNVLRDAVQGPRLQAAIRKREVSVAGPLWLENRELGVVARAPVFQRGRDGRESLWGLVAVAVRLREALVRAQLGDLPARGYDYVLFAPASSSQKSFVLAGAGRSSFRKAEQRSIRVQDCELCLALQAPGGWFSSTRLLAECVAVLLIAGALAFCVSLLKSGGEMEMALADTHRRLTRETADRNQAQEELRTAKEAAAATQNELKQVHATLEKTESDRAELLTRLESAAREAEASAKGAQAKLAHSEEVAAGLRTRLETAFRASAEAAKVGQAELEEARTALAQSEAAARKLELQLKAVISEQTEAVAAAQAWQKKDQAVIAELEKRLEEATRLGKEEAESSAAKTGQVQELNRELKARVRAVEKLESRVAELTSLLEQTQQEMESLKQRSISTDPPPVGQALHSPAEPETAEVEEPPQTIPQPAPEAIEPPLEPVAPEPDSPLAPLASPLSHDSGSARADAQSEASLEGNGARAPAEPAVAQAEQTAPEPEPPAPIVPPAWSPEEKASEDSPPAGDAPPKSMLAKPSKRRRRRNDQLDLFGEEPAAAVTVVQAPPEVPPQDNPAEPITAPANEPAAIEAPVSAEPEESQAKPVLEPEQAAEPAAAEPETEEKHPAARRLPSAPPLNLAQFRKVVGLMVPLLADSDPGARDCFKDNRMTFRSAFSPEGYAELEQSVRNADFAGALEHLRKTARKHGIVA